MPIRVRCSCGKTLAAPDAAAGRAVKCPGCSATVKVPSPSAAAAKTATATAARPTPTPTPPGGGGLDDLFDEEGFQNNVSAVCPACRETMKPGAVLCTKCGYHTQQGVRIASHKTAGVDISHADLALQKASADMAKEKRLQKELEEGGSMPTWMLGLILTILTGLILIGVLAINFSRAAEESGEVNTFNAAEMFCLFGGVCCAVVAAGAYAQLIYRSFKVDKNTGLLTLCVPLYIAVFAWQYRQQDKNLKTFLTAVIIGSLAGAFFYGAYAA